MTASSDESLRVASEQRRILAEYRRRELAIDPGRYAATNPAAIFLRTGRTRLAALDLAEAGKFPAAGDPCLEIGYGSLGWLAEFLGWGLRETDIHGLELDPARAEKARAVLPAADLRVGDATRLPWEEGTFALVVASTIFSSILDPTVRRLVADEAARVLRPGGALLWYDLRVNNPRNPNVRKVGREELRRLFPGFSGRIRTATLAPPLARRIAPRSWLIAQMLETIPILRTHLLGVLVKGER